MKKFENFSKALDNLALIERYEPPFDKVVLTGLVGLYEICFEQAWKAMKEILEEHGFSEAATGSPKQVLKTAYKAGMIYDEELWLEALLSRNNVAHSYNEGIALGIVNNAKEKYLDMFKQLKEELAANWIQS
ncbi:MAG: HI0074 family nucleotidyltransferase substrate-binding subunit [Lachnospiraceae bacterium]|nr:HI0074 family nucleotidyltransferase substrate-binding subunit [Lachnospiraceae bacterium]